MSARIPVPPKPLTPTQRVGQRLREVRNRRGWSLDKVEKLSEGRWKAVVVGSYERGDRAITVARLIELAAFYEVPAGSLLPGWQAEPTPVERREQVRRLITAAGRLLDERPAEGLALLESAVSQQQDHAA